MPPGPLPPCLTSCLSASHPSSPSLTTPSLSVLLPSISYSAGPTSTEEPVPLPPQSDPLHGQQPAPSDQTARLPSHGGPTQAWTLLQALLGAGNTRFHTNIQGCTASAPCSLFSSSLFFQLTAISGPGATNPLELPPQNSKVRLSITGAWGREESLLLLSGQCSLRGAPFSPTASHKRGKPGAIVSDRACSNLFCRSFRLAASAALSSSP